MEKHLLDILEATFFNVILVGAVFSMLYGFLLLIAPDSALTLNKKINKSFSMRKPTKFLEKPISVERWFYSNAKFTGSLLIIGSSYLFYLLAWELDFIQLAKTLPNLTTLTWEWLLQAFQIFFSIMSIVVFFMGLLIIVRPSLLKPIEEKANKWVSTRQKMQAMSEEISHTDQILSHFPRQFGAIILICSTIVLINMDKFNI